MKKFNYFVCSLLVFATFALLLLTGCGSALRLNGGALEFDGKSVNIQTCAITRGAASSKLTVIEGEHCAEVTEFFKNAEFEAVEEDFKNTETAEILLNATCAESVTLTVYVCADGSAFASVKDGEKLLNFITPQSTVDYGALKIFIDNYHD